MIVKLLTEHHLGFLSLKGGCGGSSESTLVKMSNCWKSLVAAHLVLNTCHCTCYPRYSVEMALKLAQFCDYPQKISTKSSYPKRIFIFLKTKKILDFRILNPKKWAEPTYVWKYQSTPLGSTYLLLSVCEQMGVSCSFAKLVPSFHPDMSNKDTFKI